MKKKEKKRVSEEEVANFWDSHDATEVLDLSSQKRLELIYEPPVQSISLRLPVPLLTEIKRVSSRMDIAYQALIKIWLAEKARQEINH
jgi:predicted DNA binding CopG/RHH family protein